MEQSPTITQPTAIQEAMQPTELSLQQQAFVLQQRQAKAIASSDLTPPLFRGKIANVLIAMNLAARTNLDVLTIMQETYIVQNRPSFSSKFLITLINTSGKFTPLRFQYVGNPQDDTWGCYAYATDISTGEKLKGTTVTIAMAKAEGWTSKSGSKWKTMPEQMLAYRAAAFFQRLYAPELTAGGLTTEERQDIATQATDEASNPIDEL